MSAISTAASSSNNATEENQAPTLAEIVRKLDTEKPRIFAWGRRLAT